MARPPLHLPRDLEDRILEILESENAEAGALDRLCAEQPEHAPEVKRRLEAMQSARSKLRGMLDEQPDLGSVPDRLGEFRLTRRLGGGGMGVVYLAEQDGLKREVALKLIRPEHLYFDGAHERFQREIEAVGRLQHPGIVPVYAVGEEQGVPYVVMERVRGCTLAEVLEALQGVDPTQLTASDLEAAVLERSGAEPREEETSPFGRSWVEACFRVCRQVAEALQHAHEQGVLHRDVKPSNIMLTPEGRAMLVDFGLAHVEGQDRMTLSGSTIGSVPYMTPEQAEGGRAEPDVRMDVYALGVTLYEMVSLSLAFRGNSTESTRQAILRGEAAPIHSLNRAVDWDAETVCLTAMERDPSRRYPTAAHLARDLDNVLAFRPIVARRPGRILRLRRFVQRNPVRSTAIAVAGILVLVACALLWLNESWARMRIQTRQDAFVVKALLAEEQDLWPAFPEDAVPAQRWLGQAEELLARASDYGAALEALSSRALERTLEEIERDEGKQRNARREAELLRRSREVIGRLVWGSTFGSGYGSVLMDDLERSIPEAVSAVRERYTWRFDDEKDEALHPVLTSLVEGIAEVERFVPGIRDRVGRALAMDRVTLVEQEANWRRTLAAIADKEANPVYGGLDLAPQRGLIPIGKDRESGLFEFAHYGSGIVPERDPDTGRLRLTPDAALVFVLLPEGRLEGDPPDIRFAAPVENPTVAPFFLSKYEMTQGQWLMVAGTNPSRYRAGSTAAGDAVTPLHPVEGVSWLDCDRVLRRLRLSLPTGLQWEYAARAGSARPHWLVAGADTLKTWGNLLDRSVQDLSTSRPLPWNDGFARHAPVGSFRPSPFGIHDMLGNVSEWCQDSRPLPPPSDGSTEPVVREHLGRLFRGARFNTGPNQARQETHGLFWPVFNRTRSCGLRPAREIER